MGGGLILAIQVHIDLNIDLRAVIVEYMVIVASVAKYFERISKLQYVYIYLSLSFFLSFFLSFVLWKCGLLLICFVPNNLSLSHNSVNIRGSFINALLIVSYSME